MADIQLRFGKDMLVIGSPVQNQLANVSPFFEDDEPTTDTVDLDRLAGVQAIPAPENAPFDTELALLLEPEIFEDAFALEKAAGAQCMVAPTANLTPARLAHTGMQRSAEDLARTAVAITNAAQPEHVLVELAPCGLPLDAASKASLVENRTQYERAAHLFDGLAFDAFFLNGFTSTADLKCALMGIRKVSDAPVLASVDVDGNGMLCPLTANGHAHLIHEHLEDAVAVMAEYGANVAGFCTNASVEQAATFVQRVTNTAYLPALCQLAIPTVQDLTPDDAFNAALALANAGAKFLRAAGQATPLYTGAMAAAVPGGDKGTYSLSPAIDASSDVAGDALAGDKLYVPLSPPLTPTSDPTQIADRLRQSVNDALGLGGEV